MSTRKTTLFYAVLIAVASAAIGMVIASRLDLAPTSAAQMMPAPAMNSAPISGGIEADTFRNIATSQIPAVVNISTESRRRTQELTDFFGGDEMFRRFFGMPDQRRGRPRDDITEGAGTGFVIDRGGLILTNSHVVEGASTIRVGFFGNERRQFEARIVGRDPLTDSALIELVEKPDFELQEVRFGDSDQIQPGDWVMAIGNPFGYGHTVTVGVISAKGRPFTPVVGREQQMLQTDAAINPGNSGGPLLNIRGEVVGINTAILSGSPTPGNLGIGFAVPINSVRELLPQLRTGKVTRGRIGVSLDRQVTGDTLETLGAPGGRGALVSQVDAGGPADKAGLRPGDVIVEFNGQPVADLDQLVNDVVRTAPGTSAPLKVIRRKQPQTLTVTVAELDLEAEGSRAAGGTTDPTTGLGMTLQDLTPELARQLRVPAGTSGAVVVEIEGRSPAQRAGITRGDVIVEINGNPVSGGTQASRELQRVESGGVITFLLLRGGQEVFVTIRKP